MNVDLFLSKFFPEEEKNIKDENSYENHIADIIEAKNNDIGTIGIVSEIPMIAIKVFKSDGTKKISIGLKRIDYALKSKQKEDAVNWSFWEELEKSVQFPVITLTNNGIRIVIVIGNKYQHTNDVSLARIIDEISIGNNCVLYPLIMYFLWLKYFRYTKIIN